MNGSITLMKLNPGRGYKIVGYQMWTVYERFRF